MQTGVNIQGKYKTKVADPACSFNNEQNVWFRSWTWQTSTFWLWLVLGSPLQTIFWQRETVNDFFWYNFFSTFLLRRRGRYYKRDEKIYRSERVSIALTISRQTA